MFRKKLIVIVLGGLLMGGVVLLFVWVEDGVVMVGVLDV